MWLSYDCFFLYGRTSASMVPMDVEEQPTFVMDRFLVGIRDLICSFSIKGSYWHPIEANTKGHHHWVSLWIRIPCQSNHWSSANLLIELFCFWFSTGNLVGGPSLTTFDYGAGFNLGPSPGRKDWRLSSALSMMITDASYFRSAPSSGTPFVTHTWSLADTTKTYIYPIQTTVIRRPRPVPGEGFVL